MSAGVKSFVVALVVAIAGAAGCSKPATKPSAPAKAVPKLAKLRIQMDWYPQPEQGGVYQAAARGYYREAGLDVEILSGGPGHPVITGLLAGQADVEMAQSDDVIVRVSHGLPLVMVSAVMEHAPLAVMVHEDSPVHGFADLDGRTVMALPGTTWMSYIKARYHIDFQLIPMNFSIAQFMADRNFIQQCFITSEPFYVAENGGKSRTLLVADSGYDPYRAYVTTRRYLRDHPRELRAFVAATIRGWDDFIGGDSSPGKRLILSLNSQVTPRFLDYSVGAIARYRLVSGDPVRGERTGLITARRVREQIDQLVQMRVIPEGLSVEQVADFDIMPDDLRALAR